MTGVQTCALPIYLEQLEREMNPEFEGEDGEEADIPTRRDRVEDLFNMGGSDSSALQEAVSYEPVMYRIVKDLDRKADDNQSLVEIQKGFLDRTERLMRLHQQRSHIHDGLKQLTDKEIIHKVTEKPTNLKKRAKGFLNMLHKYKVTLDEEGNPDFSQVQEPAVRKFFERK